MIGLWLVIVLALGWIGFAYVGYPLLLLALARLSPRPIAKGDATPPISIIIAVHNGEDRLEAKLEQTLALDYPGPRQIIVASDGSTDRTNAIAERFAARGVELHALAEQAGKEAAQANAIRRATGEILVFTDLGAKLEPDALRAIVRPFADARVASVSSEDVVETEGGEGAYVRFEMALRRFESEAATLIGLSGSFFAVRRELAEPWPTNLASDFRSALESARRGFRAVSEPAAQARFTAVSDPAREWTRKVRTVRRGLAVLTSYLELLHPRYGRAALAVWGHKVARFTAPWALVLLLVASAAAAPASLLAFGLLSAQLLGYGIGGAALLWPALQRFQLPRLAAFFMLVNGSILVAWRQHLAGEPAVLWQPTRR